MPKSNEGKKQKAEAREKVDSMLRKREQKLAEKQKPARPQITPADKEVLRQQKNAKREKRRTAAKTEEDFDALYKEYEQRLLKKLATHVDDPNKPAFEEIEFSD